MLMRMEMNNPLISVIVPVYNVEKYLPRCIDSILAQTFTDFELLLIDDGSNDKSGEICEEYAKIDNRIKVFHKENGGVSSARNIGLDNAHGKFVSFVDSDDWLEPACLAECLKIAEIENADIVISDYFVDEKKTIKRMTQCFNGNLINDLFAGNIFGALWNKFFRLECIKEAQVNFDKDLNFCEDFVFLCELWQHSSNLKIVLSHKAYYHYNINNISLTRHCTLFKVRNEEKYVSVISSVLPVVPLNGLSSNKLAVKWGYLRLGILSFVQYKNVYPELSICKIPMSPVKKILLIMSQNRIMYLLITAILKLQK